ncbi:16376_t:CDS:2, partial [Dentiscutata erythropus]
LRDIVNLTSINSFIEDEETNESINIDDNQNSSTRTNLILEDIINLKDPIFQEKDDLVDSILDDELDY